MFHQFSHVVHNEIYHVEIVGNVWSNIMLSVLSDVILANASRNLIYTIFSQSHISNVCDLVELQDSRFVGFAHVPYATCSHHIHQSTGQIILRVTHVALVWVALLLMVNVHHSGAELSYTYVHVPQVAYVQ